MKKYLYTTVLLFAALILLALPVAAIEITLTPTDRFFVNDFANVIDAETENALYAAGVQLYEKTKAQVVVVTVETVGGNNIHDYGIQLGRAWGIGDEEKNTGVLLLLAVTDRKVDINVGYGLEGAITDARSGIILDTYARPHFQNDDFSAGLAETYNALVNEVYIEFGIEPDPNYTPAADLEQNDTPAAVILLIFFLICIVLSSIRTKRHPGGFFFFPFFWGGPRGGGGFHGGGFGSSGFGGGGGFRGGGGSFGGGGASRGF